MSPDPAKKGFSLFEIVATLAVLSILLGTVTPVAMNISDTSDELLTLKQLEVIEAGLQLYYEDVSDFPPETVNLRNGQVAAIGLKALLEQPVNASLTPFILSAAQLSTIQWRGPYVSGSTKEILQDAWGIPFRYQIQKDSTGLNVVSATISSTHGPSNVVYKADIREQSKKEVNEMISLLMEVVQVDLLGSLRQESQKADPAAAIDFLIQSMDDQGRPLLSPFYRKDPWGQPYRWHYELLQFYSTGPNRVIDEPAKAICDATYAICGDDIDGF
ncbi:type II secretion system protein GspG [Deltaproteobacteria bacterium TL4]